MRNASWARTGIASFVALLAALALATSASAQIVVGQLDPVLETESRCEFGEPYDEFQVSVAAGNSYVVPTAGVLTSWSINEGPGVGPIGLKVFRPLGGGQYQVVGHDGPRLLTPNSLNTYPVSIRVNAGDVVGLSVTEGGASNCAFSTGLTGDVIGYTEGLAADGQIFAQESSFSESRLNISAQLLPPPVISSISPASGSIKGSTIVIAGSNFANVTGVSFGSVPATSFTVDSEGQITAVAPASSTLSRVPVTVANIAGSGTSAATFAYTGCKVPQLRGKKLKAAKKRLKKAGCKIGKVKMLKGATTNTGKVKRQSPKPGKLLAPGSKVKVTLDD